LYEKAVKMLVKLTPAEVFVTKVPVGIGQSVVAEVKLLQVGHGGGQLKQMSIKKLFHSFQVQNVRICRLFFVTTVQIPYLIMPHEDENIVVKTVYNDHPLDPKIVVVVQWYLYAFKCDIKILADIVRFDYCAWEENNRKPNDMGRYFIEVKICHSELKNR